MNAERRFAWAVLAACLLHAALLVSFGLQRAPRTRLRPEVVEPQLRAAELTVMVEPSARSLQGDAPSSTRTRRANRVESARNAFDTPTQSREARPEAESARVLRAEYPELESRESGSVVPSDEPGRARDAKNNGRQSLTLNQLGLAGDHALAYALSRAESPKNDVTAANDRLHQSLQQGAADNDRSLGLGVPAPLIQALEMAARDVAIPTNATAVFTAAIDGSGHLLGLEFMGSNHASPQWTKVSERVEQALRGRRLSITKNVRGVDFKLRLVARSQLPSGADPGLAVDLLGIPVKKGQGKRSSKISLLDLKPQVLEFEIPNEKGDESVKLPVPGIQFNVLTLAADPSDLGAPARHMIHVQVLEEKVY